MYPEITHFPINWVDGMRISAQEFNHLELFVQDRLRDNRCMVVNDLAYGLLPPLKIGIQNYPNIFILKHYSGKIKVELRTCRAVFPVGVRIEITENNHIERGIPNILPWAEWEVKTDQDLDVILSLNYKNLFDKDPAGKPSESLPPRMANTTLSCKLSLVPTQKKDFANVFDQSLGRFNLKIGKIKIVGGVPNLDLSYIPPSFSVNAHPILKSRFESFIATFREINNYAVESARLASRYAKNSSLALELHDLSYLIFTHISRSIISFESKVPYLSPVEAFNYFVGIAGLLVTLLEYKGISIKEGNSVKNRYKRLSQETLSILDKRHSCYENLLQFSVSQNNLTHFNNATDQFLEELKGAMQNLAKFNYQSGRVGGRDE